MNRRRLVRKNIIPDTVYKLEKLIKTSEVSRLPSMRSLSKKFGVSLSTISKVCAMFRSQGILSYHEGSVMRIVGRSPKKEGSSILPQSSLEKYTERLQKQIESGKLRAGTHLQKVSHQAQMEHVSTQTIIRARKILEKKKLVHKQGRNWVAGPCVSSAPALSNARKKNATILILLPDASTWLVMFNDRYNGFFTRFSMEAINYNVRSITCFPHQTNRIPDDAQWVGKQKIKELIGKLGTRYLGTLILNFAREPINVDEWSDFFLQFDKPVVCADLKDYQTSKHLTHRFFCRCYVNEQIGVDCAVSHIVSFGHKHLGVWYTTGDNQVPWINLRSDMIKKSADRYGCTVYNLLMDNSEKEDTIISEHNPFTGSQMSINMAYQIKRSKEMTVFLFPHDYTAFNVYNYLTLIGVSVPKDVSLISFDNHHRIKMLPISSVDLGFEYLGYCSFHFLLNIIKLPRKRNGDIEAKPRVFDRGSVYYPQ